LEVEKINRILHVFGPQIFWGRAPEFLEWDYKIQPASHHAAKFHGDRPRELGNPPLKKENITGKI